MIRFIKEEDIPVILKWYNHYIEHDTATFETEPLSLEEFTERVHSIIARYPWIILEKEGKPVGYAYLGSFIPRAAYNWTCALAIYLDPEETGKGYGSELMAAAIGIAQKAGCRVLLSNITKGNRASERLHEKFGFEEKGTFEDVGYKFGKWLSITYYSKKLNPTDSEPEPLVNPAEQKTEE